MRDNGINIITQYGYLLMVITLKKKFLRNSFFLGRNTKVSFMPLSGIKYRLNCTIKKFNIVITK
jgi:hypothetical protein